MTDVLLINSSLPVSITSIPNIPLGIAHLASCLEKKGIDVKILDLAIVDFNKKKVLEKRLKLNPKIVGISSTSISIPEAVNIAKQVKVHTDSNVIIGGSHVTGDPNFIKDFSNVFDYELVGEGEISFTNLAKNLLKGRNPKKRIIVGKPLKSIKSLPLPAYHLLRMEKYKTFGFITMSSRGCPYKCTYCSMGGTKVRFKDPKDFVSEMTFLKDKYNIKKMTFCDENFTINKSHAQKVCSEIIKENLDLSWSFQTRCDLVDKQTFKLAKGAGCELVRFGVESFSNSIQKKIGKNLSLKTISRAIKLSKDAGLKVGINLMFGLPMEKRSDISKSIDILHKLEPDSVGISFALPFPGTRLFDIAVQNGLDERIWSKYAKSEIYSPPFCLSNDIKNLYYFYYFNRIFLSFPSPSPISWLIVNNIKILFPRFSSLFLKTLRKDSTISETFENFFKRVSTIPNT